MRHSKIKYGPIISVLVVVVLMVGGVIFALIHENAGSMAALDITKVEPIDAVVVLDGENLGEKRYLEIQPGKHTVYAIRSGYFAAGREFSVGAGEVYDLELHLEAATETLE